MRPEAAELWIGLKAGEEIVRYRGDRVVASQVAHTGSSRHSWFSLPSGKPPADAAAYRPPKPSTNYRRPLRGAMVRRTRLTDEAFLSKVEPTWEISTLSLHGRAW